VNCFAAEMLSLVQINPVRPYLSTAGGETRIKCELIGLPLPDLELTGFETCRGVIRQVGRCQSDAFPFAKFRCDSDGGLSFKHRPQQTAG
jgi:hypothetical protein